MSSQAESSTMWYLHRKGGGRQSPERHRAIKNSAILDAQTTKCISFRDARTHSLRRKGGAASPVLDPIAPGGTSFAETTPSGKTPSVARGAVRANRSRTRDPNTHAQRRDDKTFHSLFQKKVSTSVATKREANWHEWPEDRMKLTDGINHPWRHRVTF
jgi:hypothetical protein